MTADLLTQSGLKESIMVDMSHGNSKKMHKNQIEVCNDICNQISSGENRILGVMIESNLEEGNQKITDSKKLIYGKSITDACIGWEDTKICLNQLAESVVS